MYKECNLLLLTKFHPDKQPHIIEDKTLSTHYDDWSSATNEVKHILAICLRALKLKDVSTSFAKSDEISVENKDKIKIKDFNTKDASRKFDEMNNIGGNSGTEFLSFVYKLHSSKYPTFIISDIDLFRKKVDEMLVEVKTGKYKRKNKNYNMRVVNSYVYKLKSFPSIEHVNKTISSQKKYFVSDLLSIQFFIRWLSK